ncbi:MAG: glycosyltransferase family 4 protein [Chloroflexi bacterium]|nr:glycosyltransferase family 4 protein [Chloroflexota bacterium]
MTLRIGIDVRYLSHGLVGGVHTYVANLVPELLAQANGDAVFLYADTKRAFELRDVPPPVTVRWLPYRNPFSSVYNDWAMARWMARDQLDVAHFPANYGFAPRGVRAIITLHDAINVMPLWEIWRGHSKHPRTVVMMTYLHALSRAALSRTALILTVSEYAKREIARASACDPRKIAVVPEAPTTDLRRLDATQLDAVRQQYQLTKPFVLADGLKNPAVLVRAWRLLPDEIRARHQLVFFARTDRVLPIIHEAVSAGHARLLIRPPRQDLVALYNLAAAFAFPSWIEGFGLPMLEAMTCGAPVLASDRGAIPEVAGGAALIADAEDAATWARHLARVLSDPAEAQRLRDLGFARAAQFSWREAARQTRAWYAHVAERA